MAWNRNDVAAPKKVVKRGGLSPALKGIVAGAVVIVGALVAFFVISGGEKKPAKVAKEKKPAALAEVKPAAAPVAKEEAPKEDPERARRKARAAKLKAMTPDERWQFLLEEAKKRPLDLTPSTNRTFATGTEQVMSWIFTTRLGNLPPPLPKLSMFDEAHLAEILIADNPILETDSEKQREAKEIVMAAKKELRDFIKQGGDVDQFLEYYRGQLVQAHNEWQDSQKSVMKVLREEPEIAGEYVREVNERLSKKGIKPVMIPPKLAERFGIDLETIQPTTKPQQQD